MNNSRPVINRTALIGHRGTGKSTLLRRLRSYFSLQNKQYIFIDLDEEIEQRRGQSVRDLFAAEGEAAFRQTELEVFQALARETAATDARVFVALGAGFNVADLPENWRALYVGRASDGSGRVFLDRPRLDPQVSALSEYLERYAARKKRFAVRADEWLLLREGEQNENEFEKLFFRNEVANLGGALTILPWRHDQIFADWLSRRVAWGLEEFELRDDLLNAEQIALVLELLPPEKILFSFRDSARTQEGIRLVRERRLRFDWPLELGRCQFAQPNILSLHDRIKDEGIAAALTRLEQAATEGSTLKAALFTEDLCELASGDTWAQTEPNRIYLPRSHDGRWAWYRLLRVVRGDKGLHFFREDLRGSALDQPTLAEFFATARLAPRKRATFAAVLGDPVAHSRSPVEHHEFFAGKGMPFFSIRVTADEFCSGGLATLEKLGLRYAAVTSPLKVAAFAACGQVFGEVHGAINTLRWHDGHWQGTNTDLDGIRVLKEEVKADAKVAVWGGGGTLRTVAEIFPQAEFFSSRAAENRNPQGVKSNEFTPELIIWAAPAAHIAQKPPPPGWRPKLVIDFNYTENSPARAFAIERQCQYVGGENFFKVQAAAQRLFWLNAGG